MSRKKSVLGIFIGLSGRIKEIRGKNEGSTQKEFAQILGVSQGTVNKYENGVIFPGEDVLKKIATHGGVTIEWLLHGDKSEHAPEIYEVRPRELNLHYLTEALLMARRFSKTTHPRLPERAEAELAAYLYEYWHETNLKPDQVVVKRYAALIKT